MCTEQASAGLEIEIKGVVGGALLKRGRRGDLGFYSFISQGIRAGIVPGGQVHPAGLTKFVARVATLTLSFEQKLLNSRIFYDPRPIP